MQGAGLPRPPVVAERIVLPRQPGEEAPITPIKAAQMGAPARSNGSPSPGSSSIQPSF